VPRLRSRAQTYQEERANSISHGIGLFCALIASPLLFTSAIRTGETARVIACGVYAATLILMFAASMVYHALPRGRAKFVCRIVDHGAIFLLIAGTYTPLTVGVLQGPLGWTLLILVWTLALTGVVLTAISRVRYPTLSTAVYLMLGWLILIGAKPLWERMDHWGIFWLGLGGFAYTVGVVFFAADRIRYGHLVWHLCVMAGAACHYIVVSLYAF
jgi:hemolysin III